MTEKIYQPGESYNYQLLIKHILETPLFFAPDQQIVYRDKVRLTYRAFNERVHRLANALKLLGVKKGDTVCVFDYDSHRYLECFFAVPMMGAVLHTQNWRLSPEQILYTMNHAEDDVVLIHADFLPLLEAVQDKLTTVKKIILITDDGQKPETKVKIDMEYEEMLQGAAPSYDFPDLDENTRATTFYTTGTTGLPKGVSFSHRQLVLHTISGMLGLSAYESPARFRSNDVYMPITPMFHVHAWGIPYAATLLGVKQVYPGRYEPEMLLKLILTEKVTFSHCVPTIIHMLVSSPVVKKLDLTKWKVVIGGSRLPKGLAKAATDLGIQIFSGYGMSETCPIISLANLKPYMHDWNQDKQIDKQIMTGLPVPLVYAKVVDSSGKELPRNGESTGELVLRAPWLTENYFKDPERTKDLWQDGWLHTGDVACIDPAGYIQITDRTKDVIKTGGEWISSLELENLISQHEAVSEAAAIGTPDDKWGERPLLIVVLRPEYKDKVSEEDLKKFMTRFSEEGKIPKYGVPDRYMLVDAIPKTSVGKINKIQLRKLYG
ncbi:MAG: fatty acid--CoA ligase [Deltaproteobacteria bacterium]|nr:fatty acid--CoA ligase [Deltaproteobacteria bacterium]